MKIFIDADGCPVVDITIALASKNKRECIIICDTAHVFERKDATTITVSKGADSVDFALVNMLKKNDIVVTQDYGLAAMCMARSANVLSQNGMIFTKDNIDSLLLQRHTAKKLRQSGTKMVGQKKRTPQQDVLFEKALQLLLDTELTD